MKQALLLGGIALVGLPASAQNLGPTNVVPVDDHNSHEVIFNSTSSMESVKTTFENGGDVQTIHQSDTPAGLIPGSEMIFGPAWLTLVDSDAGGSGNFANEPSPDTIAFFLSGSSEDIDFENPVSGVSMFYSSSANVVLQAFDAGGALVASTSAPANAFGPPGDPTGAFAGWDPIGVDVATTHGNVITKINYASPGNQTGIDDLEWFRMTTIHVEIDIKPGSFPNSINLGSNGTVPVAILTTDTFDAATVDPATIDIAGAGVAIRGNGNNTMAKLEDVDGDGDLDLVVHVDTENLDPTALQSGIGLITGQLFDGSLFEGSDSISIAPSP